MKRFLLLLLIVLPGICRGQTGLILLDDAPPPPVDPNPPSLGQQPFPVYKEPDLTPSETNSNQLNQLFEFETTPDTCAAGEGYATADLGYTKYPGSSKAYRYQLEGQYGFTDHIAAGAFVPILNTRVVNGNVHRTATGVGDIGFYAQYKLDQVINPQVVDVTAQLDVILPTGNNSDLRDTGKFGVRPLLLAYKDFGQQGPGVLGLYGLFGFTITTNSDVRLGFAATYQYHDLVGILEFFDQISDDHGTPLVEITPGLAYRGFSPWELAVGVPVGASKGTPDFGIIVKLTYAFQN